MSLKTITAVGVGLLAAGIVATISVRRLPYPWEQQATQPETQPAVESVAGKAVAEKEPMTITSPAFGPNESIPARYTCDGENVSPPLLFGEIPEGAKSLVLVVDDLDAPAGDWVHWTVWNIRPETTGVMEGQVPAGGVEGTSDFGSTGYGGPCPPSGEHRYQFTLYALDRTLELDSSAKKAALEAAMEGHILDQTMLVGVYSRG